jgi:hypothetical protein
MIDNETQATTDRSARRWGAGAALVAAGLAGGIILAGTMSASAATSPSPSPSATSGTTGGSGASKDHHLRTPDGKAIDPSKSQRSDEHLLTGTTAEKVRAAALATYPSATIERVETDSQGVYEAHIVTTAGAHVIVQVGTDFTVTGTQTGMGMGRGHGGPDGRHDGVDPDPTDNDGPGTNNPGGSLPGSTPSASPSSSSTA